MLNGIEVLNKVEMYKEVCNQNIHIAFTILAIVSVVILIIGIVGEYVTDGDYLFFYAVIIGFVCFILSFIMIGINSTITTTQYTGIIQYQVTIDESVSMVEFNERYEVIEVEGKIYTIVEKEESDGQRANIN